jgi:hypothetical protein
MPGSYHARMKDDVCFGSLADILTSSRPRIEQTRFNSRPESTQMLLVGGRKSASQITSRMATFRVSAWQAILDRAYGKAPTFNTNDSGTFKRAIDMTDDELAAIVAKAKLTVVK